MKKTESFEKIIKYFTGAYKNSQDSFMKQEAQSTVREYVNKLNALDNSKKDEYIKMLEEVGLTNNDLEEKKVEKKTTETKVDEAELKYKKANEYVEKNVLTSTDEEMNKAFGELLNQLEEDMKTPNDKLIETWISNYKNFVVDNKLDEELMYTYMENLFLNKYKYKVDNLEDLYKSEVKEENNKDKDKPKDEEPKKEEDTNENENDNRLDEDKTKNDDENVKKGENDKSSGNDSQGNETQEEEKDKDKKQEVKPLKIVKMTKSIGGLNRFVSIAATLLIGSTFSLGFIGYLVTFLVSTYGLNSAKEILKKGRLKNVLEENNAEIGENGILIDKATGEEIKVDIDKERYDKIKSSLIKIGAMENDEKSVIPKNNKQHSLLNRLKDTLNKVRDKAVENNMNRFEEEEEPEESKEIENLEVKGRRL